MFRILLSVVLLCIFIPSAFSAGQVQQIRQQRARQQAAVVQEAQRRVQQQVAQRVQQQAVAHQVQAIQYQQQVAIQQAAAQRVAQQQAALQQAAAQRAAVQGAANVVAHRRQRQVQQAAIARQRAVADAQVSAYANGVARARAVATAQKAAVQRAAIERNLVQHRAYQQAQLQTAANVIAYKQAREIQDFRARRDYERMNHEAQEYAQELNDNVEETVAIERLWKALDKKASSWRLIIDDEAKTLTVAHFINQFNEKGVRISKAPGHYAQMIDTIVTEDPSLLEEPFLNVLSIVAIMEYDFDNGKDPDKLAREMLGEGLYRSNRARLGR